MFAREFMSGTWLLDSATHSLCTLQILHLPFEIDHWEKIICTVL